jgi:HK97 family phage portal protein
MNLVKAVDRLLKTRWAFGLADLDRLMDMAIAGPPTYAGIPVSEKSALRLPAAWACVDLISKAGAILPGQVYRKLRGKGLRDRELATSHYLYPLVHDRVNPWLPANEWRRVVIGHLLGWGNHYSWIEWTAANVPKALWVLPPEKVQVKRKSVTDPIQYFIFNDATGQWEEFPASDILHIRGLGYDGTVGYSPVSMMRQTFGLAAAHEQSSALLHKNGITQRLILSTPGTLSPDQTKELKKSFAEANEGIQNAHKAIVLQAGLTATPFSINPRDAQFLEGAKYTDSKIYQIYGVPPHMVGDTEKSTSWGTGIEQQTIGFVTFTLLPLMDVIETWLAMKLLPDKTDYFVEYEMKGLLRGDTAARAAWYRTMIELSVYSPNRVLAAENEEPYEGGNVYRRPLNTAFVDETGATVAYTAPGGTPNETQTAA